MLSPVLHQPEKHRGLCSSTRVCVNKVVTEERIDAICFRGVCVGGCGTSLLWELTDAAIHEQMWQAVQHAVTWSCMSTDLSVQLAELKLRQAGWIGVEDTEAIPLAILFVLSIHADCSCSGGLPSFLKPFITEKLRRWVSLFANGHNEHSSSSVYFWVVLVVKLREWIEYAIQAYLLSELISTMYYPHGNCFLFSAHLSFLLLFWCWPLHLSSIQSLVNIRTDSFFPPFVMAVPIFLWFLPCQFSVFIFV